MIKFLLIITVGHGILNWVNPIIDIGKGNGLATLLLSTFHLVE